MRIHLLCLVFCAGPALSQTPASYPDGHRGEVFLPQGDLSFADEVLFEDPGDPGKRRESASDADAVLGPPNYSGDNNDGSFLTLGCGGSVEVGFTDNALIDVEGPDLYVFEVGPDVEGTILSVSSGAGEWIELGPIEGGRADIDLATTAAAGGTYRAVRLVDDGVACSGNFPGADIDAVAAIGSTFRFVLDGAVLFDVDSTELKPEAKDALDGLAADIASAGVKDFEVVGHTDADGSNAYNMELSRNRAEAVRDYLAGVPALSGAEIEARGAGETEPVADNDTEDGKQLNRRVEIIARDDG